MFHRCQRRHETPGSEAKDFTTHGIASNISFRFELVPLFLKYCRVIQSGTGRYQAHSGFMLQKRKPEFKKPTSFRGTAGCKLNPMLRPEKDTYLYSPRYQENLPSALKGDTISVSQGNLLYNLP